MYSSSREAKEFLDYAVNPDDLAMRDKVVEVIDKEFRPTLRYRRLKFTKSKQAIARFKSLVPNPELLIDVLIYLLERAIGTAKIWGNVEPSFARSLGSNYRTTLELIAKHNLLDGYRDIMGRLVRDIDYFGYGEGIWLSDLYEMHCGRRPW